VAADAQKAAGYFLVVSGRARLHSALAMTRRFVIMACAVALASGCAPSPEQVAGTYSGTLGGASETLSLESDGRFVQSLGLPSGPSMTNTGTWKLHHRAVDLTGYMHFYSEEKNGALIQPERVSGIIYAWKGGMLVRDWDTGYYALKHQ
jgi:hypothetical protein